MGLHPPADQRQVPQNIRRLVADELVGPAQLPTDETVVREHEGRLESGAEGQASGAQCIGLMKEAERARSRELPAERFGRNIIAARLATDQRMTPLDGCREPKRLGRGHDVARVGLRELEWSRHAVHDGIAGLLGDSGRLQRFEIRRE